MWTSGDMAIPHGFTSFSLLNPSRLTPKPQSSRKQENAYSDKKEITPPPSPQLAQQYPEALLEKGQPCPGTQQSWPRAGRMLASLCLQQKWVRGTNGSFLLPAQDEFPSWHKKKSVWTPDGDPHHLVRLVFWLDLKPLAPGAPPLLRSPHTVTHALGIFLAFRTLREALASPFSHVAALLEHKYEHAAWLW